MRSQPDYEASLRETIRGGLAVIVAGTGVSVAASYDAKTKQAHPQASWAGLLIDGLGWLKARGLIDEEIADAQLKLLTKKPQTHRFISAAEDITRGMGGERSDHFAAWLKRTVGSIKAHDRSILDALHAIRREGNLLATTNYDGLLLDDHTQLEPVTWLDADDLIDVVRTRDRDRIIFLHGYWRRPESVILDWKSYERITRDERYRGDLAAIWKTCIWVYVGCGVDGLNDPDFGLLLERYGQRARQAGHWDYCLIRDEQREEFQAHFDGKKLNIRAIPYGRSHADLPKYLESLVPAPEPAAAVSQAVPDSAPGAAERDGIPTPPAFYAEPDYIGLHRFVGRGAELETLNDWARAADPTNVLLFEAIGGNGKSMLTWEWTTNRAKSVRTDWAGRFWYSFYEKDAIMADFCRRALAYMTGRPLGEFAKRKTAALAPELLARLHARSWLLILDGLERVLVAYHRIDAAELREEEADAPTDKIASRNPCDAIREEDNDLLRALAGARPSKILISSRLTPRVLLNPAGQPISGARRITLPGLRPSDAEALLRSCGRQEDSDPGIRGDFAAIQRYLSENCDNHPLVVGVVGGLIQNYLPDRGNFDAWVADSEGGAKLDLASLNLTQRRNHILRAALDDLPAASRQMLSTLALVSDSVDYETLKAFNPHLPPEPEDVRKPEPPEARWSSVDGELVRWSAMSDEQRSGIRRQYDAELARWKDHERALQACHASTEYRAASKKLAETVGDLEQRGLLQYDHRTSRYGLHPVVRSVAVGGLKAEEKERYGQLVVDHFSSIPHNPYEEAETLDDLRPALHVVRMLLKLGRYQQAARAYRGELSNALFFNVEANVEIVSLLRPFFGAAWGEPAGSLREGTVAVLMTRAALALQRCGELDTALANHAVAVRINVSREKWASVGVNLRNIAENLTIQNRLAQADRVGRLALGLATVADSQVGLFRGRVELFEAQSRFGRWAEAEATWRLLDPMGRDWSRSRYRPGDAEWSYACSQFWQGTLQEAHVSAAERLAAEGRNRTAVRGLRALRGAWRLEQGEWSQAADAFAEAVRMARERSIPDAASETGLALAKCRVGQLAEPQREAERLSQLRKPAHRYLAMLCQAIGDTERAREHAVAAYEWAWGDGEPYVHRYELTKTTALLNELRVPIPELPPYDPVKDEPFPWEADVGAAIERLKAKK